MKNVLLGITVLLSLSAFSQKLSESQRNEILKKIDQEVWMPFVNALRNNDVEAYNKLHSKIILRVSNDLGGKVWTGADYFNYNKKNFSKIVEIEMVQKIEFAFSSRSVSEAIVSDQGFYKYTYTRKNEETKFIFGKFHVVSSKESDGIWRIILDHDYTDQEGIFDVKEADFEGAEKLAIK